MNSKNNKLTIISVAGVVLAVGLLFWFGRTNSSSVGDKLPLGANLLTASEGSFDFGTISMARGNVSRMIKVKNNATEPVLIEKLYTSCMCTNAFLMKAGKEMGPYGMPGHGFIPKINQMMNPGEEAEVEIVFDPAAHGPAGIGKVDRVVYVESDKSALLELKFSVMVTP